MPRLIEFSPPVDTTTASEQDPKPEKRPIFFIYSTGEINSEKDRELIRQLKNLTGREDAIVLPCWEENPKFPQTLESVWEDILLTALAESTIMGPTLLRLDIAYVDPQEKIRGYLEPSFTLEINSQNPPQITEAGEFLLSRLPHRITDYRTAIIRANLQSQTISPFETD